MKIEDIEIHVGKPAFAFQPVRLVEAKCEARTNFSAAPTTDEVNGKLRSMAASLGANAVVNVTYDSGVSLTSWRSMTGRGMAVIRESDEVACPVCAELIKRAALKCRFCGSDNLQPEPPAQAVAQAVPVMSAEPLRETNNPIWPIVIVAGMIGLLFLLSQA